MTVHRFTRSAALALVVAAVAAPTAVAQDFRNPDQRDPVPGEQAQDFRMPDTRDYADGRGAYNSPDVVVVKVREPEIAPAGGIDWADAGIGAGSLLGLSLLAIGGALLLAHRRQAAPAYSAGARS